MFFPIQESFGGGEISPRMYGQTSSMPYKKGLAYAENWLAVPQGPIRLRGGSEFLSNAHANAPFRLIPFNLQQGNTNPSQESQDYCLEVGAGYVRILSPQGPVPALGPELVTNGNFSSGISGWMGGGVGCFYSADASTQSVNVFTWVDIPADPTRHIIGHTYPPPAVPSFHQTLSAAVAPAGTYIFAFGFSIGVPTFTTAQVRVRDIGAATDVYVQGTPGTYTSVAITIAGSGGVEIFFESTSAPTKGLEIFFQGPISFRNTAGSPSLITGMPWTQNMLRDLQYAQDVTQGLFLVHPLMTPMQVKYDFTTNAFSAAPVVFTPPDPTPTVTPVVLGTAVLSVSAGSGGPQSSVNAIITVVVGAANLAGVPTVIISLDGGATVYQPYGSGPLAIPTSGIMTIGPNNYILTWADGTFVAGDTWVFTGAGPTDGDWVTGNYPSAVEIWQSRLWLAGTPDMPNTIWGSRTFDYYDFTMDAVISDASPLKLTSNTKGAIKWIRGKQSFLMGTDLHEDIIVSATQVVSTLDAQLLRESAYGSRGVQAIDIGDQVLFVSRDGGRVRTLNFNFDTQAWLSHDITYYAQHLTLPGIVAIAFARDPDNTIYVVLTDGTMRMCTYDRIADVLAWSRMTLTSASVFDCAVTVDPTGATTWLAVQRNNQWMVEIISAYNPTNNDATEWMDCWQKTSATVATITGPFYTLTVSGLANLDGLPCGLIVVDSVGNRTWGGYVSPASGTFTIPWGNPVTPVTVYVGVTYPNASWTVLPLNEGVMYGTAQGQKKRKSRIFVRLATSTMPLINGQLPANQRTSSTPMGDVEPIITFQDIFVTNLGWDRFAQFTISQPIPLETEISAVFGAADVQQTE